MVVWGSTLLASPGESKISFPGIVRRLILGISNGGLTADGGGDKSAADDGRDGRTASDGHGGALQEHGGGQLEIRDVGFGWWW